MVLDLDVFVFSVDWGQKSSLGLDCGEEWGVVYGGDLTKVWLLDEAEDAGEVGGCSGEEGREGGYGDRGGGEGEDEDIL